MKRLFYTVWALWAVLVVAGSLIIVTPAYFILLLPRSQNAESQAHKLSGIWARFLIFMFGIRIKIHGMEKLGARTAYVFISNHMSMLDIPVCAVTTRHFFKFLAKEELIKIPLLGYIIKRLYITVSRGSTRDRAKSLIKMKEALGKGISVWIFPEGTRNKTEKLIGDFQDGAFQLAVSAHKPMGILSISGTRKLLPSGESFQMRPGTIHCYWEVIPVSDDVRWLKEKAREIMLEKLTLNN